MTALRLAARVRPPVVPALLATDPGTRVLVLEYLTSHKPPAAGWMTAYATALAQLHAATGPEHTSALPAWSGPAPADAQAFLDLAAHLHISIPAGLPGELGDLLARLTPATGHALLHGDPCPDNTVHTTSGIRFIDLEQAALGDGCTELAYLRTGFPTCWCAASVPEPTCSQAETAYHDTWRSLTGTSPGDLADACAGWLIRGDALVQRAHRGQPGYLTQLPHKDWSWGTATARQRLLHRLTALTTLAAHHPQLGCLVQVSHAMRDRIQQRWPETPHCQPLAKTPSTTLDNYSTTLKPVAPDRRPFVLPWSRRRCPQSRRPAEKPRSPHRHYPARLVGPLGQTL